MKLVRLTAASTAVVALSVLAIAGTAHADITLIASEIKNADGGLCLDASTDPGSPHVPGDKVQLWTCSGSSNQLWLMNSKGEIVNEDGGLCLDASTDPGSPLTSGDTVQLWTCDGSTNQLWYTGNSNAYTTLINLYGGLALDASTNPGSPHVPGDKVQLWSNDGGTNQQWGL